MNEKRHYPSSTSYLFCDSLQQQSLRLHFDWRSKPFWAVMIPQSLLFRTTYAIWEEWGSVHLNSRKNAQCAH